jgi:tetratricopeptide (TPR) repeat protein
VKIFHLLIALALLSSCSGRTSGVKYIVHESAGQDASLKGDYAEAERHYQAALAEAEKDGPANLRVISALHNLGMNYLLYQEKYDEAEKAFLREVDAAKKVHGARHPDVLYALSDITQLYIIRRRFNEAEKYNQEALEISGQVSGDEHKAAIKYTETLRDVIKWRKEQPAK